MTVKVSEGPGVEMLDLDGPKFDVSFRLISSYRLLCDDVVTRLDVLMKVSEQRVGERIGGRLEHGIRPGVQFGVAFRSSSPGESDLVTPQHILGALSLRATGSDLVAAFRGLADRIEQELLSTRGG